MGARFWSPAELETLATHPHLSHRDAAALVGRSRQATKAARRKLAAGFTGAERVWTEREIQLVRDSTHLPSKRLGELLGRTAQAVDDRRSRLRRTEGVDSTGNKDPHSVGHRPLLARTCLGCGHLLLAERFPITGKTRTPDPRCRACHSVQRRAKGDPWKPGSRRVIARSCKECGVLKAWADLVPKEFVCRSCVTARSAEWTKANPGADSRRNLSTRQSATHHGEEWTGPQMEIAARGDLSAPRVAAMLGRTIFAVRDARKRLRVDPRAQYLAGVR